jgi:hypothetical protein
MYECFFTQLVARQHGPVTGSYQEYGSAQNLSYPIHYREIFLKQSFMWNDSRQISSLISAHLARRHGMEPRDVYKLLYQGVRGPEHIITSPTAFAERLAIEWESLDRTDSDPLWESIRPDGGLLHLNLRPFKAQGGDIAQLTTACLETARHPWGTQNELQQAWEDFTAACRDRSWHQMALYDVESFTRWLEANGFPPVHHSERYRSLYRPAYRLVAAEVKKSIGP